MIRCGSGCFLILFYGNGISRFKQCLATSGIDITMVSTFQYLLRFSISSTIAPYPIAPIRFHWPSDGLLNKLGISPPMFSTDPISIHFESRAAIAAGISYRALADSARDTLVWWRSQPAKRRKYPRGWIPGYLEATAIRQIAGGG